MAETQRFLTGRSSSFVDYANDFADVTYYGADPTGAVDSTAAIQSAIAANLNVFFPKGTYKITGQLLVRDGSYWKFNNATLSFATSTLTAIYANSVNDWTVEGPLSIIGSGSTSGTANGIYAFTCKRYTVLNVKCTTIKGWAYLVDATGSVSEHADRGTWINCTAHSCYVGLGVNANNNAEYNEFYGQIAESCSFGIQIFAGNTTLIGGAITDCTNGLYIGAGANNAHGSIIGMAINHNVNYNVQFNGVVNGEVLIGCEIYANNNSSGYVMFVNSKGCYVTSGFLSSPITNDGTAGQNVIANNYIPDAVSETIGGANPEFIWFHGNFRDAGPWAFNDPTGTYVEAVRATSNQGITSGGATICLFNNAVKNKKSAYDPATGKFTAPVTGRYRLQWALTFTYAALGVSGYVEVVTNGGTKGYGSIVPYSATLGLANGSIDVQMAAGDTLWLSATPNGTTPVLNTAYSTLQIASFDGGN